MVPVPLGHLVVRHVHERGDTDLVLEAPFGVAVELILQNLHLRRILAHAATWLALLEVLRLQTLSGALHLHLRNKLLLYSCRKVGCLGPLKALAGGLARERELARK